MEKLNEVQMHLLNCGYPSSIVRQCKHNYFNERRLSGNERQRFKYNNKKDVAERII